MFDKKEVAKLKEGIENLLNRFFRHGSREEVELVDKGDLFLIKFGGELGAFFEEEPTKNVSYFMDALTKFFSTLKEKKTYKTIIPNWYAEGYDYTQQEYIVAVHFGDELTEEDKAMYASVLAKVLAETADQYQRQFTFLMNQYGHLSTVIDATNRKHSGLVDGATVFDPSKFTVEHFQLGGVDGSTLERVALVNHEEKMMLPIKSLDKEYYVKNMHLYFDDDTIKQALERYTKFHKFLTTSALDQVLAKNDSGMILVKNKDTGEYSVFKSVKQILKNINRDRSEDWDPYTEKDWEEGLKEFTEFELITKNLQVEKG